VEQSRQMGGRVVQIIGAKSGIGFAIATREHNASFPKESSDLAGQRRAMVDQALASTMKHLDVLVLDRSPRDEAHMRLLERRTDCLGIVTIVF